MADGTLQILQTNEGFKSTMATKDARGTKRTCQSSECGSRFYDLNRDPISCPICGSVYEIAHAPPGAPIELKEPKPVAKAKVADPNAEVDENADELEDADAIEDIETDDTESDGDADNDAFLEEDEDSGNVTDIIKPAEKGVDET